VITEWVYLPRNEFVLERNFFMIIVMSQTEHLLGLESPRHLDQKKRTVLLQVVVLRSLLNPRIYFSFLFFVILLQEEASFSLTIEERSILHHFVLGEVIAISIENLNII
jgi:hypothetical protein